MGKKKVWVVITALCMTMMMFLGGCGSSEEAEKTNADGYTVTFYDSDGTTVLNTQQVAKGDMAEPYIPEKEDYNFMGWFATPQMQHPFDFEQTIDGDISVFGGFVKYQEDTREFAIVGSGTSPQLLTSNWGALINDEHKMVHTPGLNEYTITLDLNEGDEFQFVINTSWHSQRGYGYLETIAQDGRDHFANSGGLGDTSVKRSNIKVTVTGNYTFILNTYPSEDIYETDHANYTEDNKEAFSLNPYDKITWTYNGEPEQEALEIQTGYHIKGSGITNWQDVYTDRTSFLAEGDIHTFTVALKEGEEFLFTSTISTGGTTTTGTEYLRYSNLDEDSAALFDKTDSYNMLAKANGLYTFTYDESSGLLKAVCDTTEFLPEYDYYVKGSFGGTQWGTEGNPDYQLVEKEAGSYVYILDELKLEAGDELGVQSMTGADRLVFFNFNDMAPASDSNANDNFEPHSGGNIVVKEGGTYTLLFDSYTETIVFKQ